MSEINTSILAMTNATEQAHNCVRAHLHGEIRQTLFQVTEAGFPYDKALEMVTEFILSQQFFLLGKMDAESKVDLMIYELSRDDDFAE